MYLTAYLQVSLLSIAQPDAVLGCRRAKPAGSSSGRAAARSRSSRAWRRRAEPVHIVLVNVGGLGLEPWGQRRWTAAENSNRLSIVVLASFVASAPRSASWRRYRAQGRFVAADSTAHAASVSLHETGRQWPLTIVTGEIGLPLPRHGSSAKTLCVALSEGGAARHWALSISLRSPRGKLACSSRIASTKASEPRKT